MVFYFDVVEIELKLDIPFQAMLNFWADIIIERALLLS